MWKLLGAFLLFLICVMLGGAASEKLKKRADMLSGLLSDLKTLRNGLKNENLSVGKMVSELSESGSMREFWLEMKKGTDANRSFGAAYSRAKHTISGLSRQESEALDMFSCDFGTSDTESELARLNTLIEKLDEAEKTLKYDYPKKMKLLRSLSALGGIALALILL